MINRCVPEPDQKAFGWAIVEVVGCVTTAWLWWRWAIPWGLLAPTYSCHWKVLRYSECNYKDFKRPSEEALIVTLSKFCDDVEVYWLCIFIFFSREDWIQTFSTGTDGQVRHKFQKELIISLDNDRGAARNVHHRKRTSLRLSRDSFV